MKLENTILSYLNDNDNGKYVDITFIIEDHKRLIETCNLLKNNNLIIIDKNDSRNFEAFGISNQRIKRINAKIKLNGKIYLQTLKENNGRVVNKKRKSVLSYFFNL